MKIKEKLLVMEYQLISNIPVDTAKIKAIKKLKTALMHIDFNTESIPFNDIDRLTKLFESLLDRKLTKPENSIIESLIED
ncbi:hypothetical protein [Hanstruepera marina]|uniref:hypothetical protein n=1 Tax=Hanstruepera marina TaxID=2873265 RepID=UPI001CA71BF1|nr:hypothetical protein [Hanstruepera marina]